METTDSQYSFGPEDRLKLIDVSRWPFVLIAPPRAVTNEEMLWSFVDFSMAIAKRMEPHGLLLDLRSNDAGITPYQRKMMTESIKPGPDNIAPGGVGVAMVFNSALLKGMLRAIFWIAKPPQPTRAFDNMKEAEQWLSDLLANPPNTDPDHPEGAKLLFQMATAGPKFARANNMLDKDVRLPSEIAAAERWPHLIP